MLLTLGNKCIYVLELTIGFESNLVNNEKRKRVKYKHLINVLHNSYVKVKFVNLSISALGVFSQCLEEFTEMMKDLKLAEQHKRYVIWKIINTCIRTSYYIFCRRNKEWDNPQLMQYI